MHKHMVAYDVGDTIAYIIIDILHNCFFHGKEQF